MRVHHLNCMTYHLGVHSITHCLLVETSDGLVLVDTGLGIDDYERPTKRMRVFLALNQVLKNPDETAVRQVAKLGYSPQDVRHVILTHLHLDHSGGLPDFPWAEVHVYASEYDQATQKSQKGLLNWFGYEPTHWEHGPKWKVYEQSDENWFGLPCTKVKGITAGHFVLVPLTGHTPGHCGVGVEIGERWLLHCGDAYVREMQIEVENSRSAFPRWAGGLERALFPDEGLQKLRALMQRYRSQITPFSAHDPLKFAELISTAYTSA